MTDIDTTDESQVCHNFSLYSGNCKQNPHPGEIDEGTALAWIKPLDLGDSVIEEMLAGLGKDGRPALSAPQLEAVKLAFHAHTQFIGETDKRKGFLLGDGTGMGKTITAAAIIIATARLRQCGKALWLSVNEMMVKTIKNEVQRLGQTFPVVSANEWFRAGKKVTDLPPNCILYTTYNLLPKSNVWEFVKEYLGVNFNGVIIFDEAHMAKGAAVNQKRRASQAGCAVLELQKLHEGARIVYATATSAYETDHFAYMDRLGLWGTGSLFEDYGHFKIKMNERPVVALELLAMELKRTGVFLSRQLSLRNVPFILQEVEVDSPDAQRAKQVYDQVAKLIAHLIDYIVKNFDKFEWGRFYGDCLNLFMDLIISSKIKTVSTITKEEIANGRSVIVGFQHTGESSFKRFLEDDREGQPFSNSEYTLRRILELAGIEAGPPTFYTTAGKIVVPGTCKPNSSVSQKVCQDDISSDSASGDSDSEEGSRSSSSQSSSSSESSTSVDSDDSSSVSSSKSRNSNSSSSSTVSTSSAESDLESTTSVESDTGMDLRQYLEKSHEGDLDEEPSKKRVKLNQKLPSKYSDNMIGHFFGVKPRDLVFTYDTDSETEDEDDDDDYNKCKFIEHEAEEDDEKCTYNNQRSTKSALKRMFHELVPFLPINPLDQLCRELEEENYQIAELTSRNHSYHFDKKANTSKWIRRSRTVDTKSKEKIVQTFMDGKSRIAIISDACSTGISLHADRNSKQPYPRTQITVELSWGADKVKQQTGRCHRSNQLHIPKYIFVKSWIPGEIRSLSIIAKRLAQLGAICNAQRKGNAMALGFSDQVCTENGAHCINDCISSMRGKLKRVKQIRAKLVGKDREVTRVFNSLLQQPTDVQAEFVDLLKNRLTETDPAPKAHLVEYPRNDMLCKITLESSSLTSYVTPTKYQGQVCFNTFTIDRIRRWNDVKKGTGKCFFKTLIPGAQTSKTDDVGYFIGEQIGSNEDGKQIYGMFPHSRDNIKLISKDFAALTRPISDSEAELRWNARVRQMESIYGCIHRTQHKQCPKSNCWDRWGRRQVYLLSGDILGVWDHLEPFLGRHVTLARVVYETQEGEMLSLAGILVPPSAEQSVRDTLGKLGNCPMKY